MWILKKTWLRFKILNILKNNKQNINKVSVIRIIGNYIKIIFLYSYTLIL